MIHTNNNEREHTMRKGTIITTSIVGGILATALVATGSFALATGIDDNQSAGQSAHKSQSRAGSDRAAGTGPYSLGMGMGQGSGASAGMDRGHSQGSSAGMGTGLAAVESGALTSDQEIVLLAMAEEEKVAHDLYVAFGDLYGDDVFARIANAETRHLDKVRTILDRYNLTDPTVGETDGQFSSDSMQKMYDTLLAQGSVSRDAAYEAARTVEKTDIADLTAATDGVTAPDLLAVYAQLLSGSEKHLTAFGG